MAVAAVFLCIFTLPTLGASTDTWVGNTGTNYFGTNANWTYSSGSGPVASGDSLVFGAAGTGGTLLTNDLTSATYNVVTFNSAASAYTISGNAFTLGTSTGTLILTNASSGNEVFNNNITVGNASQSIGIASGGTITLNGSLSTGGGSATLNTYGLGTLTFNTVSGSTYGAEMDLYNASVNLSGFLKKKGSRPSKRKDRFGTTVSPDGLNSSASTTTDQKKYQQGLAIVF